MYGLLSFSFDLESALEEYRRTPHDSRVIWGLVTLCMLFCFVCAFSTLEQIESLPCSNRKKIRTCAS